MEKLLCFLLILLQVHSFAQSQNFKNFEVEGNLGFITSKQQIGFSYGLEARYNLSDRISVGINYEPFVIFDKDAIDTSGDEATIEDGYHVNSFSLTGDYYLTIKPKRLFVGAEIGLHKGEYVEVDTENAIDIGTKIGLTPRIGAELGWFRPAIKYTYIPKFDGKNLSNIGLTLGVVIGGGKK